MIISNSDKTQLFRYQSALGAFPGTDNMDKNTRDTNVIPLHKVIINKNSSFDEPVFISFNKISVPKSFALETQWFIGCDNLAIVCESKDAAEALFDKIAVIMEFGDSDVRNIEDIFVW